MSQPKLSLLDAPWTKAFRSFGRLLRSDPVLKAIGVSFRTWDGHPEDGEEPHQGNCPFVRLLPSLSSSSNWVTEGMHEVHLGVIVEIATKGSNIEDFFNLWWTITRAIYPLANDDRRFAAERLEQDAGCTVQIVMTRPAFRATYESSMMRGHGEFDLILHVPT